MPRPLDPNFSNSFTNALFLPFFTVSLQFVSGTYYVCSLPYTFSVAGNTYTGAGNLGTIASVKETNTLEATGVTVTLSGISNNILQVCLEDVQQGAPALIYFGSLDPSTMQVIGQPCVYYQGLIDKPTVQNGVSTSSISLAIESRMIRLQTGGQQRRYTSADQRLTHPDDIGFSWVERLNDNALKWGTS